MAGILLDQFFSQYSVESDTTELNKMDEKLKKTDKDARKAAAGIDKTEKSSRHLSSAMKVGVGILAAYGTGMAFSAVEKTAEATDTQYKFAKSLGTSFKQIQELEFATKRQGGSVQEFRGSWKTLNDTIGQAIGGFGRGKNLIKDINTLFKQQGKGAIELKKTNGAAKTTSEVFFELNKKIQGLDKGTQGGIAKRLGLTPGFLKLLQTSPEALRKLTTQADRLGIVSDETGRNSEDFDDSLENLKTTSHALFTSFVGAIMPALTKFISLLQKSITFVLKHKEAFVTFIATATGVITIFKAITIAAGIMNGTIAIIPLLIGAAIGIVIAGIAILVEDIVNFSKTGKSKIAGFYNFMIAAWKFVQDAATKAFTFITDVVLGAAHAWWAAVKFVFDYVEKFIHFIKNGVGTIAKSLGLDGLLNVNHKVTHTSETKNQEEKQPNNTGIFSSEINHKVTHAIVNGRQNLKAQAPAVKQSDIVNNNNTSRVINNTNADQNSTRSVNNTSNVKVEKIEVHTQATDAQGISNNIASSLNDNLKAIQSANENRPRS